jgi:hypothetical protein
VISVGGSGCGEVIEASGGVKSGRVLMRDLAVEAERREARVLEGRDEP